MPSDFFSSRQTQFLLNEFIRIVGNTEMEKSGGVFRNEVIGGTLYFTVTLLVTWPVIQSNHPN